MCACKSVQSHHLRGFESSQSLLQLLHLRRQLFQFFLLLAFFYWHIFYWPVSTVSTVSFSPSSPIVQPSQEAKGPKGTFRSFGPAGVSGVPGPNRVFENSEKRPEATGRTAVDRERKELPEIGWCQNNRNFSGFAAVYSSFPVGGPKSDFLALSFLDPRGPRANPKTSILMQRKNQSTDSSKRTLYH